MPVRRSHGRPRPEAPAARKLPDGVPAAATPAPRGDRNAAGKLVPGASTSELASLGGRARAEALRLERLLGRVELPDDHPRLPYRRDAADWRDAELQRLADTVGGGEVGPAVQALVSSAALQHAASRWLFDRSVVEGDAKLALAASRLADSSRANILSATEIAAREAQARGNRPPPPLVDPATLAEALRSFGVEPEPPAQPRRTRRPLPEWTEDQCKKSASDEQ